VSPLARLLDSLSFSRLAGDEVNRSLVPDVTTVMDGRGRLVTVVLGKRLLLDDTPASALGLLDTLDASSLGFLGKTKLSGSKLGLLDKSWLSPLFCRDIIDLPGVASIGVMGRLWGVTGSLR